MIFKVWADALIRPQKTIKEWNSKVQNKLKEAIGNIALSAFLANILLSPTFGFGGVVLRTLSLTAAAVIGFLATTLVLYALAKLLKGQGTIEDQAYNLSLTAAPTTILIAVAPLIPFKPWFLLTVLAYSLYLTTVALKETHKYSTIKTVINWLIPLTLLVVAAAGTFMLLGYITYQQSLYDMQTVTDALEQQNPNLCREIELDLDKDTCYWIFAQKTGNKTYCNKIIETDQRNYCTAVLDKNPAACDRILEEDDRYYCKARTTENSTHCQQMEYEYRRLNCMAQIEENETYCQQLPAEGKESWAICYTQLAAKKKDPTLCTKIKEPIIQKLCETMAR